MGILSHNLGCLTVRASDGPCNACATNAGMWCGSIATTTMHHIICCLRDLAPGKGHYFAAALADRPGKTGADQQPLAEHLPTPDWHTLSTNKVSQNKRGEGGFEGLTYNVMLRQLTAICH